MKITWKHIAIVAGLFLLWHYFKRKNTVTVTLPDGTKKSVTKPGVSALWGFSPYSTTPTGEVVKTDPVTGQTVVVDITRYDEQKPEEVKPTTTTTTTPTTTTTTPTTTTTADVKPTTTDPVKPAPSPAPAPVINTASSSSEKKFTPTADFWKGR